MDISGNIGSVPDLRKAWLRAWPGLSHNADALILVAFRILVAYLDQHRFFRQPSHVIAAAQVRNRHLACPRELVEILRARPPRGIQPFADLVSAILDPSSLPRAAELAFVIDRELGGLLSDILRHGGRVTLLKSFRNEASGHGRLQRVVDAVNVANSVLMEQAFGGRLIILVRHQKRYWSKREDVVQQFHLLPQGTATNFTYLLPTTTSLGHVHYSTLGGEPEQKLVVTLWPVGAPSLKSRAITKNRAQQEYVPFYFKRWESLPKTYQNQQRRLANLIADYIYKEADDAFNTVHIVAAPELTLAPEAHAPIIAAVETRTNAAWIVFPGSYHVEAEGGIINRAPIYLGGVLHSTALTGGHLNPHAAAVKCTPVVFPVRARSYIEDIDGRESLTHLLDTSVGRIAVMICRDFLEDALRAEIVSMDADHLVVLSMSPDSGKKFIDAMENVSHYRTSCFLVNAFTNRREVNRPPLKAAHRAPLKGKAVEWMPEDEGVCWVLTLEPR